MSDLLDPELCKSSRSGGAKKGAREQAATEVLPSATEPKDLFVLMQRQLSRDNLTVNLSRAVIQNVWHHATWSWIVEIAEADILEDTDEQWVIYFGGRRHPIEDPSLKQPRKLTFLDRARRLDQHGQTDTALDLIFDQIDEMLLAGKFEQVDHLLVETVPSDFSVELLLGILTATLPAKDHLPSRRQFFQRVSQRLQDRGELKEGLLVGLD